MVCADVFRPLAKPYARLYDLGLVLAGSLFIALSARVSVPLPFSPVPLTGQTLAVLMVGALLGSRRGVLTVLVYLTEGMMGLPVFAGGIAGPARLAGPTGGYLLGFAAAAFVAGRLAERGWDRRTGTTLLMMLVGTAAIYVVALPFLASFVGAENALALGLYPFIPGDVVKALVAAMLLPMGWKLLQPM